MSIIQIVVIGVTTAIIYLIMKQVKPELSILIIIVGSLVLVLACLQSVTGVVEKFKGIFSSTGLSSTILTPIFKIVAIGYLCEFSANICMDSGISSVADKILFAGKIAILIVSLPVIENMIEVVLQLI